MVVRNVLGWLLEQGEQVCRAGRMILQGAVRWFRLQTVGWATARRAKGHALTSSSEISQLS